MDHLHAAKAFRPGAGEETVIERMSVIDHFTMVYKKRQDVLTGSRSRSGVYRQKKVVPGNTEQLTIRFLMKTFSSKDMLHILPLVKLLLVRGGLELHEDPFP